MKNDYDGRTIADSLGSHPQLGTSSSNPFTGSSNPVGVTIVEIGKVLPLQ